MSGPNNGSETDAALAARLAQAAGELLTALRDETTFERPALGAEGDRRANALILEGLRSARPDDAILSEESRDDKARLDRSRVWIVDPLDGTREYREGRGDWAVHVALAVDGAAVAGAVALPPLGLVLRSDQPTVPVAAQDPPRMVVSRTRPPIEADRVAEAIGAVRIEMGSAGAKAMAVVRGEAEIYLHAGGQHEWDNCAPVAVAKAHGLHCSRIDGGALVYNNDDTSIPDLLICRREWAARVIAAL
ncbi:MAG TPA: 3'(2'),5'-bisphosphate nucleotidase CysQ [Novosphingobium sp.]|nr:3'(2'),5'-bisphosphate nucleotidase CysQ [Novosphingobium sp.]